MTADELNLWFSLLEDLPLNAVLFGIKEYLREPDVGMFKPKPADIRKQALGYWGRLSTETAWNIAEGVYLQTCPCWNNEIAEAFDLCRPALELGDKTGARNSFYKKYPRIVEREIKSNHFPRWNWTAQGSAFDETSRQHMIEKAQALGIPAYGIKQLGQPTLALLALKDWKELTPKEIKNSEENQEKIKKIDFKKYAKEYENFNGEINHHECALKKY
jgi:hypothetical protein